MTGALPDFSGANSLVQVESAFNELTGNIPFSLLSLPSLKYLYLNNNTLSGNIPFNFGGSTSLIDLFLQNNELEGQIPNYAIPTISKYFFNQQTADCSAISERFLFCLF